jgi:hypothetical protein
MLFITLIILLCNIVNCIVTTTSILGAYPKDNKLIINSTLNTIYDYNTIFSPEMFGFVMISSSLLKANDNLYNVGQKDKSCIYYSNCISNIGNVFINVIEDNSYIYSECLKTIPGNSINFTVTTGYVICDTSFFNFFNECYDKDKNKRKNRFSTCTYGSESIQIISILTSINIKNTYSFNANNGYPQNTQIMNMNDIQKTYGLSSELKKCSINTKIVLSANLYSVTCYQLVLETFFIPLIYSSCNNPMTVSITDYFYSADSIQLKSPCFVNTYDRNNPYDNLKIKTFVDKVSGGYKSTIQFYVIIESYILLAIPQLIKDSTFIVVGYSIIFNNTQTYGIKYLYAFDDKSIHLICRGSDYRTYRQENCNLQVKVPALTILNNMNNSSYTPTLTGSVSIDNNIIHTRKNSRNMKHSIKDISYNSGSTSDNNFDGDASAASTNSGVGIEISWSVVENEWFTVSMSTIGFIGFIIICFIGAYYYKIRPILQELNVLRELHKLKIIH